MKREQQRASSVFSDYQQQTDPMTPRKANTIPEEPEDEEEGEDLREIDEVAMSLEHEARELLGMTMLTTPPVFLSSAEKTKRSREGLDQTPVKRRKSTFETVIFDGEGVEEEDELEDDEEGIEWDGDVPGAPQKANAIARSTKTRLNAVAA